MLRATGAGIESVFLSDEQTCVWSLEYLQCGYLEGVSLVDTKQGLGQVGIREQKERVD